MGQTQRRKQLPPQHHPRLRPRRPARRTRGGGCLMTIPHTTNWLARCRSCGTAEVIDLLLPIEIETGATCEQCGSAELTVTETSSGATITFFPAVMPPVKGWQCCHCGGTGLEWAGDPCEHCEGIGQC